MEGRERRVVENEARFRDVNERLAASPAAGSNGGLEILCECGDPDCVEGIVVAFPDYERARSDGAQFLVRPGHLMAGVESVVLERDGYALVRKAGEAGRVAEELDPRDR